MLTKATAIARLRATGTLANDERKAIVVSVQQARCPLATGVNRLMMSNARVHGPRHVAPATSQAVLP